MRIAALVVVWVISSAVADAQPALPLDDETPVESYRLQVLGADAVSYALLLGSAYAGHDARQTLRGGGASIFLVGAPVVHLVHGRLGRGVADVGLRIAIPAVGALVGSMQGDDEGSGVAAGFLVGAAIASVLDAAWLAGGDEPRPTTGQPVATTVSPVRGGAMLGLGGSF